jgi:spore coat protein H
MTNLEAHRLLVSMVAAGIMAACGGGSPGVGVQPLGSGGSENNKPDSGLAGDDSGIPNPCGAIDTGLKDKDAAELFGMTKIPTFDLYLPDDVWQSLKVHARDEQYVQAQACFERKAIGLVGLRFKGSYGSLYNCFDASGNNTCRKLGMKIKFDEYVQGQHLYGVNRLNFQGYHYDDSYMKEHIAYDLYRAMGIVAPRASWALLHVNDEPQGLFGMVEDIDGRFTKDRWPNNGDQNLYKEVWPDETSDSLILQHLQTNTAVGDISAFKAFSQAINSAAPGDLRSTLGSFSDLDYWARYMAVDDAIANFDGITTYYVTTTPDQAGNHNFYFYQEAPNRFTIIPWDLESTMSLASGFGNVPYWQTTPSDCSQTYLAWGGPLYVIAPGCNRVFQALSADLANYRAAAQSLLDGPFAQHTMDQTIDSLASFIRAEATVDPHGPGATQFENAVSFQKQEIPHLRQRLQRFMSGLPTVSLELDVTKVNDFETSDDYGINAGTTLMFNANSTGSVAVNTSEPLDGAQSLRISFNFGNDSKAWDQWLIYRIPLADAPSDLTTLTGIRLKIRSNQDRTVRFDINSPYNSQANAGINKGWDLAVTTQSRTLTVQLASAAVPSWATDPGDRLTQVLQTANAFTFQPICNGRDNISGQLPAGVTDNGWVDVDDLEFY